MRQILVFCGGVAVIAALYFYEADGGTVASMVIVTLIGLMLAGRSQISGSHAYVPEEFGDDVGSGGDSAGYELLGASPIVANSHIED